MEHTYSLQEPLNPPCNNDTKVFILVLSRRESYINREAIRLTWLKDAPNGTVLRFFLADQNIKKNHRGDFQVDPDKVSPFKLSKFMHEEHKHYDDTVFLKGIPDTYANLHYMVHAAFQWQQTFCPQAKYVMKTDDDTVVHLERLFFWIKIKFDLELDERNPASCFGNALINTSPIREKSHKWYVPEEVYPHKKYPNYVNGCTYMCSAVAIKRILEACPRVKAINMEDVLYTGIVAQEAN
uniref:Hexosyltransferase n=1 Tax=Meloidogyne javanica TaxID=6303 RepID=A0A915M9I1_MELJA